MIVWISKRQLASTVVLSAGTFLPSFVLSRFVIDLSLRDASALILQSAHQLERHEQTLMQQFGAEYELLDRKLNGIKTRKESDR